MYHLPYNSHTVPRSLVTVCFNQWMSPNCLAWHNMSLHIAQHPNPTARATVSPGYNNPARPQRQLWSPISSNTEQSCFHSPAVKTGGSGHAVALQMPFVPSFTPRTLQKGRGCETGSQGKHCTSWVQVVWVILLSCLVLKSAGGVGNRKATVIVLPLALYWMQPQ